MAIKSVRYHVLNVGQGQGNYIEIVDDKGSVVHNILIDLGSSSKAPLSAKNLKWLNDAIGKRPDPRIDVVLLTHGDADHYSLISGLEPGLGAVTWLSPLARYFHPTRHPALGTPARDRW